jgi:hypothetical protein
MNFSAIISVLLYIHFLYVDGLTVWTALVSLTFLVFYLPSITSSCIIYLL